MCSIFLLNRRLPDLAGVEPARRRVGAVIFPMFLLAAFSAAGILGTFDRALADSDYEPPTDPPPAQPAVPPAAMVMYKASPAAQSLTPAAPLYLSGQLGTASTPATFSYTANVKRIRGLAVDYTDSASTGPTLTSSFVEYNVRASQGTAAGEEVTQVVTYDDCGSIHLELAPPKSVLIPVNLDPSGAAVDDDAERRACFKVRRASKRARGSQLWATGLDGERLYDLVKPTRVCMPIGVSNGAVSSSGKVRRRALDDLSLVSTRRSLVCYKAKLAKREIEQALCGPLEPGDRGEKLSEKQPKHEKLKGLSFIDQFGGGFLSTRKEGELCLYGRVLESTYEFQRGTEIYVTWARMDDFVPSSRIGLTYFLGDGNVNGNFSDPEVDPGYLDGPELSIFDSPHPFTRDCHGDREDCGEIAITAHHASRHGGLIRPLWGATNVQAYLGTLYRLLTSVARDYFDFNNTLDTDIAHTHDEHELVVITRHNTSCANGCMRPEIPSNTSYKVIAGSRPDGETASHPIFAEAEDVKYYNRPKMFLGKFQTGSCEGIGPKVCFGGVRNELPCVVNDDCGSGGISTSAEVPVHEFGHFYTRVMAKHYGRPGCPAPGACTGSVCTGGANDGLVCEEGGFDFLEADRAFEEGALDEGLGYWFFSDWVGTKSAQRDDDTGLEPQYSAWAGHYRRDNHFLGNVITFALWDVREESGCNKVGVRRNVFALVDSIAGGEFGNHEIFGWQAQCLQGKCAGGPRWLHGGTCSNAICSGGRYNGDTCTLDADCDEGCDDDLDCTSQTRGFAAAFLDRSYGTCSSGSCDGGPKDGDSCAADTDCEGACDREQANAAAAIFMDRELMPAWLTQTDTGANNGQGDRFGAALAVGDFNNDNYGDLAIGSPGDSYQADDSGLVHIVYGSKAGIASGGFGSFERIDQVDASEQRESGDNFGEALATGNFNGDDYDDLAVGTPGEDDGSGLLIVFYGSAQGLRPANVDVFRQSTLGGTNDTNDVFTWALAVGDFDDDGKDDLAIGSPGKTEDGAVASGLVYVLRGSASGLVPSQDFGQADLGSLSEPFDSFGWSLATGDFNMDGKDDLAIGAPFEDLTDGSAVLRTDAGKAWVVYGRARATANDPVLDLGTVLHIDQAVAGYLLENGDQFGYALAAGDFDGDGADELAIGSPGEGQYGQPDSGELIIFYGSMGGGLDPGTHGHRLRWDQSAGSGVGEVETNDRFGETLAFGDFDDDGFDDLAVGVPGEDVGELETSGEVVIYRGRQSRFTPLERLSFTHETFDATNAHDTPSGAAAGRLGSAIAAGNTDFYTDTEFFFGAPTQGIDTANEAGVVYLPLFYSLPAYPLCGNLSLDRNSERCDGMNLDGNTCMDVGFGQGTLGCNATDCNFDTSQCTP